MENNVVNLETEFFKKKSKDAYQKLVDKDFKGTINVLKEAIERIEEKTKDKKVYCPQNIFDAAIFLNFLEPKAEQKDFAKINYYDYYLMNAAAYYNLSEYEKAKENYTKALELNPASSVARLQLLEIDKIEKNYIGFKEAVRNLIELAYRRNDIARAYRDMGYYLYEIKDYEMSIVAYYLSNLYELSETTINEIEHIAKNTNIDLESKDWLSEEMMGKFVEKYNIPLMPNQNLVTLALAMAEDSYNKKAYEVSRFSYTIAYELTLEEEYKNKVEEINKIIENNKK